LKLVKIEETKYTPKVILDPTQRQIDFYGKSYPENTFEFYQPILNWLEEYFAIESTMQTVINFEIIYFNSGTSKIFFDIFDILEEAKDNGCKITVNWIYDSENDASEEAGEDYKEDFSDLNFNLVEK
jgi:hypothetical protein